MSRPTDTERGARMAREIAIHNLHPDFFPDLMPDGELWWQILAAADAELADQRALRVAING